MKLLRSWRSSLWAYGLRLKGGLKGGLKRGLKGRLKVGDLEGGLEGGLKAGLKGLKGGLEGCQLRLLQRELKSWAMPIVWR